MRLQAAAQQPAGPQKGPPAATQAGGGSAPARGPAAASRPRLQDVHRRGRQADLGCAARPAPAPAAPAPARRPAPAAAAPPAPPPTAAAAAADEWVTAGFASPPRSGGASARRRASSVSLWARLQQLRQLTPAADLPALDSIAEALGDEDEAVRRRAHVVFLGLMDDTMSAWRRRTRPIIQAEEAERRELLGSLGQEVPRLLERREGSHRRALMRQQDRERYFHSVRLSSLQSLWSLLPPAHFAADVGSLRPFLQDVIAHSIVTCPSCDFDQSEVRIRTVRPPPQRRREAHWRAYCRRRQTLCEQLREEQQQPAGAGGAGCGSHSARSPSRLRPPAACPPPAAPPRPAPSPPPASDTDQTPPQEWRGAVAQWQLCGCSELPEVMLFHGTEQDKVPLVLEKSFDPRIASLAGRYGAGTYFASRACKSHQYTSVAQMTQTQRHPMTAPFQVKKNASGGVGLLHCGTQVADVLANSSAQIAGIAPGMTIVAVNGVPVSTGAEVSVALSCAPEQFVIDLHEEWRRATAADVQFNKPGLLLSMDCAGSWWPVTVSKRHSDGTYSCVVFDDVMHAQEWDHVHLSNMLCRGEIWRRATPADIDRDIGNPCAFRSLDSDGQWWPITVVQRNADAGTVSARVHDAAAPDGEVGATWNGALWPKVFICNIVCRGAAPAPVEPPLMVLAAPGACGAGRLVAGRYYHYPGAGTAAPVWRRADGDFFIYLGQDGHWTIGGAEVEYYHAFATQGGWVRARCSAAQVGDPLLVGSGEWRAWDGSRYAQQAGIRIVTAEDADCRSEFSANDWAGMAAVGTLLLSRVTLGRPFVTERVHPGERLAPDDCHSIVALTGPKLAGALPQSQLHEEFVVFDRDQATVDLVVEYEVIKHAGAR